MARPPLSHPLRREILKALARYEPMCAKELAPLVDARLNVTSYHLVALAEMDCVQVAHKEKRRGATAVFYQRSDAVRKGMNGANN